MMWLLEDFWFRLCLCRNRYRDQPSCGGALHTGQDATEAADKGRGEGLRSRMPPEGRNTG
jgi:hypothetical protein